MAAGPEKKPHGTDEESGLNGQPKEENENCIQLPKSMHGYLASLIQARSRASFCTLEHNDDMVDNDEGLKL